MRSHLFLCLVKLISFVLLQVACSNAIKFSRLIELYFTIEDPVDWLEPFICLLQNSPILKALTIFTIVSVLKIHTHLFLMHF